MPTTKDFPMLTARNLLPILFVLQIGATPALAQSTHSHTENMQHDGQNEVSPMHGATEPGNDAFASIAEIVALLRDDQATNWEHVDIEALRIHLLDMDALISETSVTQQDTETGVSLEIQLAGRGGEAAARMVPAHGPVLWQETGWASSVEMGDTSIVWSVESPVDANIIQALGFYGLMTIGDHHAAHHLGLAQGKMVH